MKRKWGKQIALAFARSIAGREPLHGEIFCGLWENPSAVVVALRHVTGLSGLDFMSLGMPRLKKGLPGPRGLGLIPPKLSQ